MTRGSTPATAAGDDARDRLGAGLLARRARADDQRRGAVIDAGSVARGDDAAGEQRLQLGEAVEGGVRAGMLVLRDHRLDALLGAGHHRLDLAVVEAGRLGLGVFLLRGRGEAVGGLAADPEILADIVGGLRHRVLAVLLADSRIREARADRRIEDPDVAPIGAVVLRHDERGAAHALDAAGDEEGALAAARRPSRRRSPRQGRCRRGD